MRARCLIALFAAYAQLCGRQAVKDSARQQKCRVEGVTLDYDTGEPLPKTTVSLSPRNPPFRPVYESVTDASGRLHFDAIPDGAYVLAGERPGYLRTEFGARQAESNGKVLRLNAADKPTELTLKLTHGSVVSGKVLDDTGNPASTVLVHAISQRWMRGHAFYDDLHIAETNDRGEYRIANLPAGHYYLCAEPFSDSFVERQDGPEMARVLTCYPDSRTLFGADQVQVQLEDHLAGFDMKLPVKPVFHIRGSVKNAAALDPDLDSELRLTIKAHLHGYDDYRFDLENCLDENGQAGKFDFSGATPGTYDLELFSGFYKQVVLRTTVEVKSSDVNGIVLRAPSSVRVRGVVRSADDDGITPLRGYIGAFDIDSPFMSHPYSAEVEPSGSFELKNVWPGRYVFSLRGIAADAFISSIEYGGREMLGSPVELTNSAGRLEITVSKGVGRVHGSVAPADAAAGAIEMVLMADPSRLDLAPFISTADQNGHFAFSIVPPGAYYAFAVADVDSELLANRDLIAQLQLSGVEVDVGQSAEVQLRAPLLPVAEVQRAMAAIQR